MLNETPRANRVHIAIFGKTNSGKSSFVNALTNQEVSLVSDIRGTTTDPVYKSMEINGLGPCVLIDTAGFDDESILGKQRVNATYKILDKTDLAIILFSDSSIDEESKWLKILKKHSIPTVAFVNKMDIIDYDTLIKNIKNSLNIDSFPISALKRQNIDKAIDIIVSSAKIERERSICGHIVDEKDIVMLVMPQDIQAPKGRLILPQVQTIRDLLDNRCIVISTTVDNLENAISMLKQPPKLIITDSQVFPIVKDKKPEETILTSFSVLFSKYKGDIDIFLEGANTIGKLKQGDKVLIAEACTHNPLDGDIARIKLPNLLRKNYGKLDIQVVSGNNFPQELDDISLIIHCGSCMFNRKYVMSRIEKAQNAGVPITNYGLAIAYMNNMMDSIIY